VQLFAAFRPAIGVPISRHARTLPPALSPCEWDGSGINAEKNFTDTVTSKSDLPDVPTRFDDCTDLCAVVSQLIPIAETTVVCNTKPSRALTHQSGLILPSVRVSHSGPNKPRFFT
jgi:hypothetical protein